MANTKKGKKRSAKLGSDKLLNRLTQPYTFFSENLYLKKYIFSSLYVCVNFHFICFHFLFLFFQEVRLSAQTVLQRGLVAENVKFKDVVREHANYCDTEREFKHFPGETLAYVTPVGRIPNF